MRHIPKENDESDGESTVTESSDDASVRDELEEVPKEQKEQKEQKASNAPPSYPPRPTSKKWPTRSMMINYPRTLVEVRTSSIVSKRGAIERGLFAKQPLEPGQNIYVFYRGAIEWRDLLRQNPAHASYAFAIAASYNTLAIVPDVDPNTGDLLPDPHQLAGYINTADIPEEANAEFIVNENCFVIVIIKKKIQQDQEILVETYGADDIDPILVVT